MLGTVALTQRHVDDYAPIIGEAAVAELRALAAPLRDVHAIHLSLAAFGTSVTDLLSASVPLLNDLGVDAGWYVVRAEQEFEPELQALYAAINGAEGVWTADQRRSWERFSTAVRPSLPASYDAVVVHDPQLVGLAPEPAMERNGTGKRWLWHDHHDLSAATAAVRNDLRAHTKRFDAVAVDDPAFLPPEWHTLQRDVIAPGIDPLGPRNVALDDATAAMLVSRFGIDPRRPFIAQLSPLDEGSDIIGLIEVFDALRLRFPELQLVIVPTAVRDVQATRAYFDRVAREAKARPGCLLLPVAGDIGNAEINAVQQLAAVVVQKSLQRGFALWLSESMWKERPVVAGRTTGTLAQVVDGSTGYLAPTTAAAAERIGALLSDQVLRERMGNAGRRYVRERFLITRYVAETLRLLARVVGSH